MGRKERARGRKGLGGFGRSGRGPDEYMQDDDFDDFIEDDDLEDAPPVGRGKLRAKAASRTERPRFDWGEAESSSPDETEASANWVGDGAVPAPTARRRAARRSSLMELCMPVFAFTAMLPREGESGGVQPSYETFREQILAALREVEARAGENRIEAEDAAEACYALSLFVDGQVLASEWIGKQQWAAEPLYLVLHQDPAGGVNFFRRLEALGERQKAVKEVYLVCLSLGYRGRYAELDPAEQASQVGALRQRVLREIHTRPLDQRRALFPEAYVETQPVTDQVPPPPRWWLYSSLGVVGLVALVWLALFWVAGRSSLEAEDVVKRLAAQEVVAGNVVVTPATDTTKQVGTLEEEGP